MILVLMFIITLGGYPFVTLAATNPQTVWLSESGPKSDAAFVTWKTRNPQISEQGGKRRVAVGGRLAPGYTSLLLEGVPLTIRSDGSFDFVLSLPGARSSFRLKVTDPKGKVRESLYLLTTTAPAPTPEPTPTEPRTSEPRRREVAPSKWRGSFGMGITQLHYAQTAVNPFIETLLTVKGGVETTLVPNQFNLGIGVFYNFLELANTGDYKFKVLGTNVRVGYFVTAPTSRFMIKLNGGIYYNTSISDIGFKNMLGPQVFPEFNYRLSKNQGIMIYFKYSPVLVGGDLDIIRSRELATGLYYRYTIGEGKSIFLGLDYAELDAYTDPDEAHTRTFSLGLGMGF